MEKISVSELIQYIKENEFHLERPPQSVNRKPRYEEWMFSNNEVPPFWSNTIVNVEQSFSNGPPFLSPIAPIFDEESHEGTYRFPKDHEFDSHIIRNGVNKISGTDALAWYRPFHMEPFEKWGITILDQGIWYIARYLADEMFNVHPTEDETSDCVDIATDFLYYHELFHFKVELATTMAELNSNNPFYKRYWFNGFNSESETIRGKSPLEEALANSFARNKALEEVPTKNRSQVRKALDSFIKSQPDGYKDGHLVRGPKTFRSGVEELICKLVDIPNPIFDTNKLILEHVFFDGIHGKEDWLDHYVSQVPCRIIKTGFAQGLFSASVESLFLSEFCATKTFRSDYKNIKQKHVKKDFQEAMHEWEPKLGRFRTTGRDLKPFRGLKGKRNVREFRVRGKESWRVYFEKFENGEKLLLKMHLKTPGKQNTAKNSMNKRSYDSWTIFKHNESCEHQ